LVVTGIVAVGRRPDVAWRDAVPVEERPVVRHVLVRMLDQAAQMSMLIGTRSFREAPA
jgi:hypothetical protein